MGKESKYVHNRVHIIIYSRNTCPTGIRNSHFSNRRSRAGRILFHFNFVPGNIILWDRAAGSPRESQSPNPGTELTGYR
jgi:hypothetical protein